MVILIVVSTILSTLVGALIGNHKGYTSTGVVLGLILGWIGVIIIACMGPSPGGADPQGAGADGYLDGGWAAHAGPRSTAQWQIPPQRLRGDQRSD